MSKQPAVVVPSWAVKYRNESPPPQRRSSPAPPLGSSDFPPMASVTASPRKKRARAAPVAAAAAAPAAWGSCEAVVTVAAAVEDGLEEQWRAVYDPAGTEKDRERGGLVLRDGTVNPGHFCFNPNPTYPLSPLSAITPAGVGGSVRLGDCGEVSAGWDHTQVIGPDAATHKHAAAVYAHFHVHADNADLLSYRCGGQTTAAAAAAAATVCPPVNDAISRAHRRPASVPSMGDIAAWLCYHRNQPRAFVLTRDSCWLLFKWKINGHAKGGIECPVHATNALFDQCNRRRFEPITSAADVLLRELPRHGFAIYHRKLADRPANGNGMYQLWAP